VTGCAGAATLATSAPMPISAMRRLFSSMRRCRVSSKSFRADIAKRRGGVAPEE
jgi:hypothetical protein